MLSKARALAGELNVVMAVASGDLDIGLANHYYTLRLKKGRPEVPLDLALTNNDAGCLLNVSGVVLLYCVVNGTLILNIFNPEVWCVLVYIARVLNSTTYRVKV